MTKTIFNTLIFTAILFFSSCGDGKKSITTDLIVVPETASGKTIDKYPVMTFEKTSHDFGQIIRGERVSYRFKFKNTGKLPLIISDVPSSCGCTVPEFSKLPVSPGEEGYVMVTFNSQTESGYRAKTVTVVSNAQPRNQTLTISANVVSANQ
jgi:hypothetical protein